MSKKESLSEVNFHLLLSALDPKRKDIIVTRTEKKVDVKLTEDLRIDWIKTWVVKNATGEEIFSFKYENELRYRESYYGNKQWFETGLHAKLNINGLVIDRMMEDRTIDDTKEYFHELQTALDDKISAQEKAKAFLLELKNMSPKNIMAKKYLERML